ncbi:MAG TPA: hypothetical protein VIY56_19305, partial [Vicinamibacterales bacterium]
MRKTGWAWLAGAAGLVFVLGLARAEGAMSQAPTASAQQEPAAAAGFVGMDTCLTCHEEVVNAFKATPHMSSAQGCEGCHGPGQAHAENAGDKTKIRVFKTLSTV